MNVSLTKELESLVDRKVRSGLYHTASEVVREGLRLLDARDRLYALRLEELRAEVKKGLDSGPPKPLEADAMKARLRARMTKKRRKAR
jgi:antitoxin ParD1/3/4